MALWNLLQAIQEWGGMGNYYKIWCYWSYSITDIDIRLPFAGGAEIGIDKNLAVV
jgi:hypothetical protein